jgi:hypothetical protein
MQEYQSRSFEQYLFEKVPFALAYCKFDCGFINCYSCYLLDTCSNALSPINPNYLVSFIILYISYYLIKDYQKYSLFWNTFLQNSDSLTYKFWD